MAKYVYPAVFTPEEEGGFSINFPDLEGCYTCGDDMLDALIMARDVLALILYGYEEDGKEIPIPSERNNISISDNEFINFVECDTLLYRKMYLNKSVKKTLTIPEWMNDAAMKAGLNFSQVLQEALASKLNI